MKCTNYKCRAENSDDAVFCHECGIQLKDSPEIDNKILAIIRQNSYSQRILAAYEGRKYANQICKEFFDKTKKNYREYVEMLMAIHYPKELDKANLGKKYLSWLYFSIIPGIGTPFIFLKVIPLNKQIKELLL